jgi:hypothetical protein
LELNRFESDSERIPRSLLRGLASEYDKEDFLAIRYLAALLGVLHLFFFKNVGMSDHFPFAQINYILRNVCRMISDTFEIFGYV